MWAEERQQQILGMLARDTRVEADALSDRLAVSRETIRRDLKRLEEAGLLRRTHGGAIAAPTGTESSFVERLAFHAEEKAAIARAAASLVAPGESCFVDAGSTTRSFAQALSTIRGVSVITNSVDVALALRAGQPDAEVLLLGGVLGRDVPATFGGVATEQLAGLRADVAFISPVGIDREAGVSYYDLGEAELARMMLRHARRRVVLADASKIGVVSRSVVLPCNDVDVLVSDYPLADELASFGVKSFVYAGQGGVNPPIRS